MLKMQVAVSMSKQQISTNSSPFFKGKNVMALKIDQDYPNSNRSLWRNRKGK